MEITQQLKAISSITGGDGLREMIGKVRRWFEDLPVVSNGVLVGLILLCFLGLLIFLSPLAVIIAALGFVVSIIASIIRVVQRRPIKRWGIVAATSLVLAVVFGGFSNTIQGIGSPGGSKNYAPVKHDTRGEAELKVAFDHWAELNNSGRPSVVIEEVRPSLTDPFKYATVYVTLEEFRQPGPNPTAEYWRKLNIQGICSDAARFAVNRGTTLDEVRVAEKKTNKELTTCEGSKESTTKAAKPDTPKNR